MQEEGQRTQQQAVMAPGRMAPGHIVQTTQPALVPPPDVSGIQRSWDMGTVSNVSWGNESTYKFPPQQPIAEITSWAPLLVDGAVRMKVQVAASKQRLLH